MLVYSLDVRGCGRSEGPRMKIQSFYELVSDHNLLLDAIVAKHPNKKIFTFGVSMGGGINVFLSLTRKEISGMVLIAPMVQVSPTQSPFMQKVAPILAATVPNSKVSRKITPASTPAPFLLLLQTTYSFDSSILS